MTADKDIFSVVFDDLEATGKISSKTREELRPQETIGEQPMSLNVPWMTINAQVTPPLRHGKRWTKRDDDYLCSYIHRNRRLSNREPGHTLQSRLRPSKYPAKPASPRVTHDVRRGPSPGSHTSTVAQSISSCMATWSSAITSTRVISSLCCARWTGSNWRR